ncbi:hypothetical protein PR048_015322 [Dryococelus australis]|uniref:Uncharacterized protein n=1 Tax=Dryococelus australis TaxID=614101 RepID=A0ABQ9HHM9_9NEOP|nr:hypothetical protein PR048_015322 [Dryococelus australis]
MSTPGLGIKSKKSDNCTTRSLVAIATHSSKKGEIHEEDSRPTTTTLNSPAGRQYPNGATRTVRVELLDDNGRPHVPHTTTALLPTSHRQSVPICPDLALTLLYLFGKVKKHLRGRRFSKDIKTKMMTFPRDTNACTLLGPPNKTEDDAEMPLPNGDFSPSPNPRVERESVLTKHVVLVALSSSRKPFFLFEQGPAPLSPIYSMRLAEKGLKSSLPPIAPLVQCKIAAYQNSRQNHIKTETNHSQLRQQTHVELQVWRGQRALENTQLATGQQKAQQGRKPAVAEDLRSTLTKLIKEGSEEKVVSGRSQYFCRG